MTTVLPDPLVVAALVLLGGVVALDATSLGQFMLSRPLVAATLAGLVAGNPVQGAAVGVVLEALHLAVLPVGAARYPEAGPAAAAAAGVYAAGAPGQAAPLLIAVLFALAWEWVCGETVVLLRQRNGRGVLVTDADGGDPKRLEARHLRAVGMDFARGAALTLAGVMIVSLCLALPRGFGLLPSQVRLALGLAGAAAIASSLRLFGRRRLPLFLAGAAAGAALLLAR